MSMTSLWALYKITLGPLISLCRVMDYYGVLTVFFGTPTDVTIDVLDCLGTVKNFPNLLRHNVDRFSRIPPFFMLVSQLQLFTFSLSWCTGDFTPIEPSHWHWHSHCSSSPLLLLPLLLQVKSCATECYQLSHLGMLLRRMVFLMTPNHQVRNHSLTNPHRFIYPTVLCQNYPKAVVQQIFINIGKAKWNVN